MFLLTKYVMALQEAKMRGGCFYLGARTQGKTDAFPLVRTVSPIHTEVRVFVVFVKTGAVWRGPLNLWDL